MRLGRLVDQLRYVATAVVLFVLPRGRGFSNCCSDLVGYTLSLDDAAERNYPG